MQCFLLAPHDFGASPKIIKNGFIFSVKFPFNMTEVFDPPEKSIFWRSVFKVQAFIYKCLNKFIGYTLTKLQVLPF